MNKAKNWVLKETGEYATMFLGHGRKVQEEQHSRVALEAGGLADRRRRGGGGAVLFVFSFPVIYEAKAPARADGRETVKTSSGPEHGRHGANRFCFAKNH